MKTRSFRQTSSLLKKLRITMVVIAIFFLLGFAVNVIMGLGFFRGLTAINRANKILALASQVNDGLNSSELHIERMLKGKDIEDAHYAYQASQKFIHDQLHEAQVLSHHNNKEIKELLKDIQRSLQEYEIQSENLFQKIAQSNQSVADLKNDHLVAIQFMNDARESLRRAQILVKQESERSFSQIYDARFYPTYVAIFLTVVFFTFVIIIGLGVTRRISRSINNLTEATNAITEGDLQYRAPILYHDEVGNLTDAFNHMVRKLKEGQEDLKLAIERLSSLQNITAAFSEALTPDQVFDVIFKQGFEALGAKGGSLGILSEDGTHIEMKRMEGFPDGVKEAWSTFPINTENAMSEVVRFHQPIFLGTLKEIEERYPNLGRDHMKVRQSVAVLPLIIGSEAFGALAFIFGEERQFSQNERDFMVSLGRQCSQAIHRSQLYDEAKDAIRARDEFLSIASHELKTPLTPLRLQLQGLARQVQKGELKKMPEERLKRMVDMSDKQIGRLTNLIEDLLDVSRITSGKLTLNREPFDLSTMVHEVMANYGQGLKASGNEVRLHIEKNLVLNMDKIRIEQVLINLLTNAAKYAPGRPIDIYISSYKGKAQIIVKDQGPGIAWKDQQRIFDRFERVKDRDNIGGLGLGLYISRQIVEAHDGRIRVESELGNGASFIVELPLMQDKESVLFT